MAKQQVEFSIAQKVLEERMKNLEANNTKEHADILKELVDFKCSVNTWMDGADRKYASKLTEKIMYGLVGSLLLWAINSIIHVVDIH
jgi:hypothetical protein